MKKKNWKNEKTENGTNKKGRRKRDSNSPPELLQQTTSPGNGISPSCRPVRREAAHFEDTRDCYPVQGDTG